MKTKTSPTLTHCILETLKLEELSPNLRNALLTPNGNEVNRKTEGELWDYKEMIDLDNPTSVAKLAKRILAFHNNKGGVLIVGVTDSFKVVGFSNAKILDNSRLNAKLRAYIGDESIIFQDRLSYHNDKSKSIWLVFIKPRGNKPPKPIKKDSPDNGNIAKQGQYFIRINDEVKKCTDHMHLERLFCGVSFTHLKAYTYERDELFFRLLLPHTDKFIGRRDKKDEILNFLNSRYFILSLDGPGGIGKTALAIETVNSLYKELKYDFIISLSAKNKVWLGHSATRQSDFSGLSEFLREIATVLDIDQTGKNNEDLESEILELVSGLKGILLVDNIEEITDKGIFNFIQRIPDPVKVIVTSRVSKDLGALRIDVPRMSKSEAKELFEHELRFHNYHYLDSEVDEIEKILNSCGYLPLAIKWAASFIQTSCKSLKDIYNKIKQMDASKQEFLDFIFSSMYDELSDTAKEVALLSTYLDVKDWTDASCAVILNKEEGKIKEAISELEDRDILIKRDDDILSNERNMLPITVQFLKQKWHENANFRVKVERAIEELVPIQNGQDSIFDLPINERLKHIYIFINELEKQENYDKANKLIRLARQWFNHDSIDETLSIKLCFCEGKMKYLKDRDKENGIETMKWALTNNEFNKQLSEEWTFLAIAMMDFGRQTEEKEALQIFSNHLSSLKEFPKEFKFNHFERFFAKGKFQLVSTALLKIKSPKTAYHMYTELKNTFQKTSNIKELGKPICDFFDLAKQYKNCSERDKINLENLAILYSQENSSS